ncbi:ABC transporter ATP-binding protein [Archaeoglobus veneficus]|uniref:Phosphonate-transporting ATPase n=1 Tax=Archaeoglobus veneficus (strain DSM 11195 / SNP6) TaxID=693661 RepID=F2KRR8_ARCVS|nr:ABC transporter ATP-binding protein [Archaeoglobus veneficus]AEA47932.1 Phosphonate-transporting ATPase [Archaeoglobus veneficus SNP6]
MLKVKGLKAYYDEAEILRGIDLEIEKGEAVAVLGPNGAGKTTLIRAICGLVRSEGEIVFDGRKINGLKTHERIRLGMAVCPEGRRLFPNLTVEDNLLLAGDADELETVYSLFPRLKERRKQLVKTMSGGEQQMVAIGRALMLKPKLLMLDEPSIGLAPIVVDAIGEAISKIRDEMDISILIVEQNIHLAFRISQRAYVLVKGEIVKEGGIEELHDLEKQYFEA